jgi:hypothetical protein
VGQNPEDTGCEPASGEKGKEKKDEKHTELNARQNDPGLSAGPGDSEADIAYQGPV